jgi:hypothetical protein
MQHSPDEMYVNNVSEFCKENGEREFLHRMSTKCEVGDPFVPIGLHVYVAS